MHARAMAACLPFVLAALAARGEGIQGERSRIATVGKRQIYLDEILGSRPHEEKPAKPTAGEIANLASMIRAEVIRQEILKRKIDPPDDKIEQEAAVLAQQQWESLGQSEEERRGITQGVQFKMKKLREGLLLWKEDEVKGNGFAREELAPLGITDSIWRYYTSKASDPQSLKQINRACSYDKEKLRQDCIPASRRILEMRELKRLVVGDVAVTGAEVGKLLILTQQTELLEVIVVADEMRVLRRLKKELRTKRSSLAHDKMYRIIRLSSSDLDVRATNPHRELVFLMAIHCPSLAPHSASDIFKIRSCNANRHAFLYVLSRTARKRGQGAEAEARAALRDAIAQFKRQSAFDVWLSRRMREKTTILDPRFREVEN